MSSEHPQRLVKWQGMLSLNGHAGVNKSTENKLKKKVIALLVLLSPGKTMFLSVSFPLITKGSVTLGFPSLSGCSLAGWPFPAMASCLSHSSSQQHTHYRITRIFSVCSLFFPPFLQPNSTTGMPMPSKAHLFTSSRAHGD